MPAQQPVDEIEDLDHLTIVQALDDRCNDGIVGELLKIADDGFLVGVPVESEADESIVGFDESVSVSVHAARVAQ
jgi:hypothetical protein